MSSPHLEDLREQLRKFLGQTTPDSLPPKEIDPSTPPPSLPPQFGNLPRDVYLDVALDYIKNYEFGRPFFDKNMSKSPTENGKIKPECI
jgi:hypothetical protein